ncbi:outer membrane beta-barrel protein [Parapedobacter pyrenivorans]|uniref:outer membrane beta-barrel protein n=1 Tax=Parapedobacter pyrenivorans TaxID=1305674 RepID=UPI0033425D19
MKKKTKLVSLIVLFTMLGTSVSFGQAFEQGDKLLNIGVGLGSQFMAAGAKGTPPVGLSLEFGVSDKISVGAYGGYAGAKVETGMGDWKYNYIILGGRGSYHFDFGVENLDPYAGVLLGYNIASVSTDTNLPTASAGGFIWGAHAGARYFFSPKFGAFAEVGYGIAWLNVGVALKF